MSVNIAAFGNERDGPSEDNQQPSLIWSYLRRSALISEIDCSLSASHVGNPGFTEYQASVFGNVRLVVRDCPVWDIFDSDWYTSRSLIGGADIVVIKYSVNDKTSFQELKDNYIPMIKKTLNHCSVPVIISAIGARKNGVPCTCPLCTSDRRRCVTTAEGVQLAKELGATYLELHTLNDFYIQKYFGGVLEYFMIQSLNQKSPEKMKRRKKTQKCHRVQPPQLEQPAEKMPILKGEASHYDADLHNLLCCCQCADVAFYPEDFSTVVEAHKVILCSVSHLFMLLFKVKSPADICDTSIMQTAQSLFTVEAEAAFPLAPRGIPPCIPLLRVVVKDSAFCSCLPDILHFIYSGAFQWERLEEDIKKKVKDPEKTENVLGKVKCILKTPRKLNTTKDCKSQQMKRLYNTSLRLFFNTPVLADVIFKIQDATVPAHRAVLVARCESIFIPTPAVQVRKVKITRFYSFFHSEALIESNVAAFTLLKNVKDLMYNVSRKRNFHIMQ
ncbi:rho-related BTB domain-containing protein 3 isoform X4 [Pezoporus flaviventris]|uniref:rho-related BTB domain-containing protein 3 isoform X4 n=1 Tax=Pezoporus flaviventris TaxID=889875 RepID=UPI002AB096DA|nr:rho-related BTB domain-containing protein 3 isoform X4 [Pezoporus flaviventris]